MAGTAENVQVVSTKKSEVFDGELSPTDLNFNTTSLQEMIDSELALRLRPEPEEEEQLIVEEQLITPEPVLDLRLESDPSEQFIQVERLHTAGTLNVFSDTIDLSPDCEHPFPPLTPSDPAVSPIYENIPFTTPEPDVAGAVNPLVDVDSDESPVTEDVSDLEPMPLFTQTITSDHEQSPLIEVNPFIPEVLSPKEVLAETPVEISFSPHPFVNVKVIEPPDLSPTSPVDIPQVVIENGDISIEEIDPDTIPHEPELEAPLVVVIEPEMQPETVSVPADSVDHSVSNSMREFGVANIGPAAPQWRAEGEEGEEWTTVEDAVKEVQSCEAVEEFETQDTQSAEDIPSLHVSY